MSRFSLLRYSDDDVAEIVGKFGATVDSVRRDVDVVVGWLKTQSHLPEIFDEGVIKRFLLLNKCRIEIVKKKIDMYYTVRSMIPEFYCHNPNGPTMQKVMDTIYFVPLPKLTKDFCRIVIVKAKDLNVENFDAVAFIAHTLNVAEFRLRQDFYHKEIQMYDLGGLKLGHLTKFTPSLIKKISFVVEVVTIPVALKFFSSMFFFPFQKVFSNIIAAIHLVNVPNFIDTFFVVLKKTLNPKLAERLFVHKDCESLLKTVSKDVLPIDYGGCEKNLDELSEEWRKTFVEFDGLFKHLRELRVNEKLRSEPLPFENDLFGVEGTFKQLNID
ncbi:hypothetical protein FQR65_LT13492 [Abscondita terminalis]|nr:hypothetical protein FQR65_LT13492 [Abscondita terminalis]